MRILITGVTGLLGSALVERLSGKHEVVGLAQKNIGRNVKTYPVDICDKDALYRTVTKINPDLVIHSAAHSNVDDCEKNPDLAYRVNALGTRNIALACQRFDTELLHISTDYIFSGKNATESGYIEPDVPEPLSVYARSKLQGEWFVEHLLHRFYVVRTSWLFGNTRPNFISNMVRSFKEGKPVTTVVDMVSAPTYVNDLAEAIERLITSGKYGIYHLSNSGFASRYQIAQVLAAMTGAKETLIKKVTQEELKLPALRPQFSGLRNFAWELEGFEPLRPWQKAVEEFLTEHQNQ